MEDRDLFRRHYWGSADALVVDKTQDRDLFRKQYLKEYYGLRPVNEYASWQDRNNRSTVFKWLIDTLKDENTVKPGDRIYFPAANTQLETRAFSKAFPECVFVGGDAEKSNVMSGKKRGTVSENTDLLVADAFYTPMKGLDMIVDFGGAAWYALEVFNKVEERAENINHVFCEYHKALAKGGRVLIDDYSRERTDHFSTVDLLKMNTPEIYDSMKSGSVKFRAGKRPYSVKGGTFDVEEYEAEFKVSELYVRKDCKMYVLEKI